MSERLRLRRVRVGAVLAVAAVAGFLVWYFATRDTGGGERANARSESVTVRRGSGPVGASESDLATLSDQLGQPIYWAGEQPDTRLELTRTLDGRIYVRYLTGDAKIGAPKAAYLTIGTYPLKGAYRALQDVSTKPGAIVHDAADHGLVVSNAHAPGSVYLAYPKLDFQIEIYDPSAKRALALVTSGAIEPAG